jgi:hypothetical protein
MKKVLVIILCFLSVIALIIRFGAGPLVDYIGANQRAGVRIESTKKSSVFINNEIVGETPYQNENLKEQEYLIGLAPIDATDSSKPLWQGYVKLNNGTLGVVNRELGMNTVSSSGEIITLKQGNGVTIVSTPVEALVTIDGKEYGRTPLAISSLTPGEHQFMLSKENYLKRSIRATLVEGYALTLSVDLAISEADLSKSVTVPVSSASQVSVKRTPTGFLRVRADATTNAAEVTRVSAGEVLSLLEEKPGWARVRLKDGKEGWVSSAYIEKK